MGRKKKSGHGALNHERWLVSYADFITLLFAFFVVMYAISSVNEGKYRVLATTLDLVFKDPKASKEPIQVGDPQHGGVSIIGEAPGPAMIPTDSAPGPGEDAPGEAPVAPVPGVNNAEHRLSYVASSLESTLKPFVEDGAVELNFHGTWLEIDMKTSMLFKSGDARLSNVAINVLRDVSAILKTVPHSIRVEGNTDNVPIKTLAFPSNWELSAARSASVVDLLVRLGVQPSRLEAVGYGEYRPKQSNDTEQGRQANRRVSIVVLEKPLERGRASGERKPAG